MAKIRVYELAKELGIESKEMVNKVINLGIEVKNHMSALENDQVETIRKALSKNGQPAVEKKPEAVVTKNEQPKVVANVVANKENKAPEHEKSVVNAQFKQNDVKKPEKIRIPMKAMFEQPHRNKPQNNMSQQNKSQQNISRPQAPQQQQNGPRNHVPQYNAPRPNAPQQHSGPSNAAKPNVGQPNRPQQNVAQRNTQQRNVPPKPFAKQQPNVQSKPADVRQINNSVEQKPVKVEQKGEAVHKHTGKKEREEQKLLDKRAAQNKNKHKKEDNKPQEKQPEVISTKIKTINIGESISVQDLALKMNKNAAELIKKLIGLGVMATINQEVDSDTASILAGEFGFEVEVRIENLEEEIEQLLDIADAPETLQPRAAVVTVMGHVDHGKTSLLDAIRHANVLASEAGGITQHIGAYQVEHNGKKITFLDTPGHAAFTAMRARGAQVTDVSVLVVAADDGVMPQTIEAINHSKAANVPVIVAINKIDKPGANPDKVKQELTEHGLIAEEWGGETICVPVSAKSKEGLDQLLEMILLVAEIGDLRANPGRAAKGTVIEAQLDKGRGSVATVLVQTGTLNVGDPIVAGYAFGKVRAMMDYKGRRVKSAGPSMPVEVLGLSDVPQAGDIFYAVEDEKLARSIATKRMNKKREEEMKNTARVSLEDLYKQIQEGQVKDLNIIIKADVQGSIEALKSSLVKLSNNEVRVNAIHGGVGAITETDIMLASASNAIVIGFNVRPDNNAKKAAESEKVDVKLYRVIYNAIEDVKAAMTGLLEPEYKEVVIGTAEVRQIFKVSKVGTIAGSYVTEGKIAKNAEVRLIRDGIVLHEGKIDALKRFKDDAKEVAQGYECGITLENFNDIFEGDIIEAFIMEEIARELK